MYKDSEYCSSETFLKNLLESKPQTTKISEDVKW
jgi:hypothetical protein